MDELPQWLSDDGLTVIFTSGNATARQPYRATRSSTAEDFGPRELLTGFFTATEKADSFTIPATRYLEENGCQGDGYAARELVDQSSYEWRTFKVCLGSACP